MKLKRSLNRLMRAIAVLLLAYALLIPFSSWALDSSERWGRLSPDEKAEVQRNYQRWQNLPRKDKEHLQEEWNRWQSLPKDRRDRLQRRYEEQRSRPKEPRQSRDR